MPTASNRRASSRFSRSRGLVEWSCRSRLLGEVQVGEHLLGGFLEHLRYLGEAALQAGRDLVQLSTGAPRLRCSTSSRQDLRDGPAEPPVGVGDHQLYSPQPARYQPPQELCPELIALAGPHVPAQHLPLPVLAHPHRHHCRSTGPPGCRSAPAPAWRPTTGTDTPPPGAGSGSAPWPRAGSWQIRDTSLRLTPSNPKARTRSSTFRVLTPAQGRLLHHAHQRPLCGPGFAA
jgi:hypothetical protein